MSTIVVPFVIMITNVIGTPASLGYPSTLYEKYIEPGQTVQRQFATQEACEKQLATVQQIELHKVHTTPAMPAYKTTMIERIGSMKCLPAGSLPQAQARGLSLQPLYKWRIGRIGQDLFFKGQSLDMRQFDDRGSCENANRVLQDALNAQAIKKQGPVESLQHRQAISEAYRCYQVIPVTPHQARWKLWPPMVPNGAYLVTQSVSPRY